MRTIKPSTNPSRPVYSQLKSGDVVVLHLRDAGRIQLAVKDVEADAIVATDGTRYLYADIQRVQVRVLTRKKSMLAWTAVGVAVFVIAALTSSSPLLPPGGPSSLSGR